MAEKVRTTIAEAKQSAREVTNASAEISTSVDSIKQVAAIVSDIANASIEQSTGIEQVNKALTQMDEVTQQNSALVEENAATAKTLEHQAKSMDEQVAFFQIDAAAGAEGMTHARVVTAMPVVAKAVEARAETKLVAVDKDAPVAKRAAANGGGARRVQAQLATAIKEDPERKEF